MFFRVRLQLRRWSKNIAFTYDTYIIHRLWRMLDFSVRVIFSIPSRYTFILYTVDDVNINLDIQQILNYSSALYLPPTLVITETKDFVFLAGESYATMGSCPKHTSSHRARTTDDPSSCTLYDKAKDSASSLSCPLCLVFLAWKELDLQCTITPNQLFKMKQNGQRPMARFMAYFVPTFTYLIYMSDDSMLLKASSLSDAWYCFRIPVFCQFYFKFVQH